MRKGIIIGIVSSFLLLTGITFAATILKVPGGGTGSATFGQGWLNSSGGTSALSASTSPTVNYITSTSTTATSTFAAGISFTRFNQTATSTGSAGINLTGGCFAVSGTCISSSGGTNLSLIYSSTTVGDIATSSFTSIPASSYYQVELDIPARTTSGCALQYNGDTAANYGFRFSGGDDGDSVNAITIDKSTNQGLWLTFFTNNVAARQKVFRTVGLTVAAGSTGGALRDTTGTWNNTSNQISSIQIGCGAATPSGTKLNIYGNSNGS